VAPNASAFPPCSRLKKVQPAGCTFRLLKNPKNFVDAPRWSVGTRFTLSRKAGVCTWALNRTLVVHTAACKPKLWVHVGLYGSGNTVSVQAVSYAPSAASQAKAAPRHDAFVVGFNLEEMASKEMKDLRPALKHRLAGSAKVRAPHTILTSTMSTKLTS